MPLWTWLGAWRIETRLRPPFKPDGDTGGLTRIEERCNMEKQTLTFTLERETKNTIRYAEDASSKPPANWNTLCPEVVAGE